VWDTARAHDRERHEAWPVRQQRETQAREDMERIAASGEDLSKEPDAWNHPAADTGEINIIRGTG
jgi:hypothetical protein